MTSGTRRGVLIGGAGVLVAPAVLRAVIITIGLVAIVRMVWFG